MEKKKTFWESVPSAIKIILGIFAIIGILIGAIPNIIEFFEDSAPRLGVYSIETNIDNACVVYVYNYGNNDAKDVALSVLVIDEQYGSILATNYSIFFPILPKPRSDGKPIHQHILVRFDEYITTASYLVRTIVESADGVKGEGENTINII